MVADSHRCRDGHLADRPHRLRRPARALGLLSRASSDGRDSGAGCEHLVRRLPAFGWPDGARPLPAAAIHERGRSAGLLERDPPAGFFSVLLAWVFKGDTSRLIPRYAVGVFLSFALSQSGMVRHWWRAGKRGEGNWRRAIVINGLGALATALVLVVFLLTKSIHGAWIVVVIVPLFVLMFKVIHHSDRFDFFPPRFFRLISWPVFGPLGKQFNVPIAENATRSRIKNGPSLPLRLPHYHPFRQDFPIKIIQLVFGYISVCNRFSLTQ
jgi:hypothetical protein